MFPAYLQGMESPDWRKGLRSSGKFPAYLQGMERVRRVSAVRISGLVPSLPTRNGNCGAAGCDVPLWHRSQPTYKEWKSGSQRTSRAGFAAFPAYLQGMEITEGKELGEWDKEFPAYLQGMEIETGGI